MGTAPIMAVAVDRTSALDKSNAAIRPRYCVIIAGKEWSETYPLCASIGDLRFFTVNGHIHVCNVARPRKSKRLRFSRLVHIDGRAILLVRSEDA